ncbi:MAG: DUF1501 domain-containing protein [Pseudomonadota bacterium]|jgi:uncharacterized protein (DUF1501 family)
MTAQTPSRRDALRAFAAFGAATPFALNLAAMGSAAAQTAVTDYKALVCIFLQGGNDSNNLLLATDSGSWNRYWLARFRGADPIALMPPGTAPTAIGSINPVTKRKVAATDNPEYWGGVLPITPKTPQYVPAAYAPPNATTLRTFALHPMLSKSAALYGKGRLAALANVGTLLAPLTRDQYLHPTSSAPIPPRLYSHNDQQSAWQSGQVGQVTAGWGGEIGDVFAASSNAPSVNFTSFTTAGASIYPAGNVVKAYRIGLSSTGATAERIDLLQRTGSYYNSTKFLSALQATLLGNDAAGNSLGDAYRAAVQRSVDTAKSFQAAVTGSSVAAPAAFTDPLSGKTASNPLAQQLHAVAQTIAAHAKLGPNRQVFFVQLGGFDTHDRENARQSLLLAQVDHALDYFDSVMQAQGYGGAVTAFTASDFNRTFTTNGDGTDHAWGGHHLILGGAVKGGDIYGTYPTVGLDDASTKFVNPDAVGNALIPTTSVDQYLATMGRWFGVSDPQLGTIFPRLSAFKSANLGFMG